MKKSLVFFFVISVCLAISACKADMGPDTAKVVNSIAGIRVQKLVDSLDAAPIHSKIIITDTVNSKQWQCINHWINPGIGSKPYTIFVKYEGNYDLDDMGYFAKKTAYYFYGCTRWTNADDKTYGNLYAIKISYYRGTNKGEEKYSDYILFGDKYCYNTLGGESYDFKSYKFLKGDWPLFAGTPCAEILDDVKEVIADNFTKNVDGEMGDIFHHWEIMKKICVTDKNCKTEIIKNY